MTSASNSVTLIVPLLGKPKAQELCHSLRTSLGATSVGYYPGGTLKVVLPGPLEVYDNLKEFGETSIGEAARAQRLSEPNGDNDLYSTDAREDYDADGNKYTDYGKYAGQEHTLQIYNNRSKAYCTHVFMKDLDEKWSVVSGARGFLKEDNRVVVTDGWNSLQFFPVEISSVHGKSWVITSTVAPIPASLAQPHPPPPVSRFGMNGTNGDASAEPTTSAT